MITHEGFNEVINTIAEIYPKDVPSVQGQKIYFMIFSKNFESDEEFMNTQEELINFSDLYKNTVCGVLYV
jgi:hypothetical protein